MNRGIGGDNTFGVLARLEMVVKANPKRYSCSLVSMTLAAPCPKR
ncbi:hypothetical protein [Paraflavitalea speifideaquila]|nr:hypothetical protein [Paraflavitalea speifideiaquila]